MVRHSYTLHTECLNKEYGVLQWCSYRAKSRTLSDKTSQMSYRFQQAQTKCPIETKFWRTMSDCERVYRTSTTYMM